LQDGTLEVLARYPRAEGGRPDERPSALSAVDSVPTRAEPDAARGAPQLATGRRQEVQDFIVRRLASQLSLSPESVDVGAPLARFGLDSIAALELLSDLEEWLKRSVPGTLLYDHPTIAAVATFLCSSDAPAQAAAAAQAGATSEVEAAALEPVAIIGLACRFPGGEDKDAFWKLLCDARSAVSEVPGDRWNVEEYYDADPSKPGKMYTRRGGFLKDVRRFDPMFFGISPREARQMDPQQRILLELTWDALEDAGIIPEALAGSPTGVFVGVSVNDYARLRNGDLSDIDGYTGPGNAHSIAANRISYVFDLRGPSLVVDTACSASLVAVHQACQSLRAGECSLALVGGANVILAPEITVNFCKAGVMSPDGACKTFDARANGYVRGEGAAIFVLKRLTDARRDKDRVYAAIRATAVNSDGRSNGIIAPNREAQEAVIREAYRRSGIDMARVQYVEAHGTGTLVGDSIEAHALGATVGSAPGRTTRCAIGSVKTNIGHLEAAAGAAGLAKTVLALHHGVVPASINFERGNPDIPFEQLGILVQTRLGGWPAPAGARIAGLSSFGFGGTNAHAVLVDEPNEVAQLPAATEDGSDLLVLSAHTPEGLDQLAAGFLERGPGDSQWTAVCASLARRRQRHRYRLAAVSRGDVSIQQLVGAYLKKEQTAGLAWGEAKPRGVARAAFVFPGQGPHWRPLDFRTFPADSAFMRTLIACDELVRKLSGRSVLKALEHNESHTDPNVAQPTLFSIQAAVAAQWRAWGVEPAAVVGHSMGEVAAAHVAGALSLEDAATIIVERARLLRFAKAGGRMAEVELNEGEVRRLVAEGGCSIELAAMNSDVTSVLAGDGDALRQLVAELESRNVFCKMLEVDYASHSSFMDPALEPIRDALRTIQPRKAQVQMFSTVRGTAIDGAEITGQYWADNLRLPVLFTAAIQEMCKERVDLIVEISPHPVLSRAVADINRRRGREIPVVQSLTRRANALWAFLCNVGAAYTHGATVDFATIYPHAPVVSAVPYPFERQTHWIGGVPRPTGAEAARPVEPARHPLLGRRVSAVS
ncbi:MAG: acyltransferase domain-containing protein, partial [Myxococcota bacterium]|nr:acyltransferase domain-containing protein [Myxococcota bacterium]